MVDAYSIANQIPALGVGITYSTAIEPLLNQCPHLFDVVEIEPQTTWFSVPKENQPYKIPEGVLEHLSKLPGQKIIHSVGVPVGGILPANLAQIALLQKTIEYLKPPWFSEHLSFNSTSKFATGFLLPPRQTQEGVDKAAQAIKKLQECLSIPVAIETGVNYLSSRPDEMSDGSFVTSVIEGADCGLLLDLHNLFTNAINGRQSVEDFLAELPLERVWEVHLAGGMEMDGFWLDAHSGEIPDELLELAQQVIPLLPSLKAVIFEIFPSYVPVVGLNTVRKQIEKLHDLWNLRNRQSTILNPSQTPNLAIFNDSISPEIWVETVGSLVIGRHPDCNNQLINELIHDPGIKLINKLVNEFRAAMVVRTLRLTSRLIILTNGSTNFQSILEAFWSKHPPQLFASSEAEAFSTYLQSLDLVIPRLSKVIEFEQAVIATLIDEQPRLISFDFDPLPLLRALTEGHLPEIEGREGCFEIEVTSDGPVTIMGIDMEDSQQIAPFH